MVVVGSDVHKKTHTFVGVDEAARELGHQTFPATTAGHQAAIRWARERFGTEVRWAVEDCRHLSARLERDLLAAGQVVVRVAAEDDG
jgi:transposase